MDLSSSHSMVNSLNIKLAQEKVWSRHCCVRVCVMYDVSTTCSSRMPRY